MWFATSTTEYIFAKDFDEFGDSFTQPINVDDLKQIFDNMESAILSPDEIADVEFEHFPEYKYGLFRRCKVYIDDCSTIGDSKAKSFQSLLDLYATDLKFYGAVITTDVDQCSHVLVHSKNLSRLKDFMDLNRKKLRKFHIVNENWVTECIDKGIILSEVAYQPVL